MIRTASHLAYGLLFTHLLVLIFLEKIIQNYSRMTLTDGVGRNIFIINMRTNNSDR